MSSTLTPPDMSRVARTLLLGLTLLAGPATVAAQASGSAPPADDVIVRTIGLRYLTPGDAASLVSPFITSRRGGAFSAGEGVRAVTIRETPAIVTVVERLLREHDRPPVTVRLHFQLIRADGTPTRDPALAEVDSAVRSLLRITGLHLEGEAMAQVDAQSAFQMGFQKSFGLRGRVTSAEPDAGGRVRIEVALHRDRENPSALPMPTESLISTALTVQYGTRTVLGTSTSGGVAYILTVRPERVPPAR